MPLLSRVVSSIGRSPVLHRTVRLLINWVDISASALKGLDVKPGERILDVGCGIGMNGSFSGRGIRYVGIDLDHRMLRYAARRHHQGAFLQVRIPRLPFRSKSFDKALVVNVFHHLSDEEAGGLCQELERLVTGLILIVDADPEVSNPFQKFLLSLDPGKNFRGLQGRVGQISPHLKVLKTKRVTTPSGSVRLYFLSATAKNLVDSRPPVE